MSSTIRTHRRHFHLQLLRTLTLRNIIRDFDKANADVWLHVNLYKVYRVMLCD